MVWRETISTTATLGFRIEGIRKGSETSKDFKTVRSQEKVKEAFSAFVGGYPNAIRQYLDRLYSLRNSLKKSRFFATHEVSLKGCKEVDNKIKLFLIACVSGYWKLTALCT